MFRTLVSTAQLADHLHEWAVVDCRFELANEAAGQTAYLASHIPGAVYAHLTTDLSGPLTGSNGRHPLPTVDAMASTFSRLGIGRDTQVVAYDGSDGMFASRLWWMLRYLGHDAVAVLNGGFTKWVSEGRAVRGGEESRRMSRFEPQVRHEWLVTLDDLLAGRGQSVQLVDARAPERFEGRIEPIDRVAGHIPGARNRCYKDNVESDGTMKLPEQLRAEFVAVLEGHRPADAIMYCGSGVTACHNLLAMEHAGLGGTPLYVGSWSEWSADPARPIETGPPRNQSKQEDREPR